MYRRETKFDEGPKWLIPLMSVLRFLSVTTLALLLLGPIIKSLKEDQKDPIVIVVEDRSSSIAGGMNNEILAGFNQKLGSIKESLKQKYQVETVYFGDKVQTEKVEGYKQGATNIADALKYVYENYADQNIGSIILASDGIYNEGNNPNYENVKFNAPLHTIALGDTTLRKDLFIKNILHNKIAYLGDKFTLKIDLAANNCSGSATKLKIEKVNESGRKIVQETPLNIDGKSFFKSVDITLDADQTGIIKYSISASTRGETEYFNSRKCSSSRCFSLKYFDR
jgi:hypothetical protein